MPLSLGTALGPYQVEGILGVGGMGEVYRARDPRLNRSVALKVLPSDLTSDPERVARFKREAQALAALSHPNIVTIYSIEEAEGIPFLTMELVDGRPLTEMIPQDGLSPQALLSLTDGITQAIAAAHERGITHRDLKPANVMVMPDGRVKVLDFGLARFQRSVSGPNDSTLATEHLTGSGTFVGTVAYMSPEQAEGKPVDHRSDIFSVGVLLYEMATGDRPFKGDTLVSIISSILRDDPPLISEVRPIQPAALAGIIRRCLQKEPSQRYQTAIDLRRDLDEIRNQPTSKTRTGGTALTEARVWWRSPLFAAAALIAALTIVASVLWFRADDRVVTLQQIQALTSDGQADLGAMSRDGRYVVHVKAGSGRPSLWVRQTATASDVQIVPPADVQYNVLAFSPDDNHVLPICGTSGK